MSEPEVYEHYRPAGVEYPDGIYRVVGTDGGVTLLRVGDATGQRVHTGDVLTVPDEEFEAFESAENPDGNRSVSDALTSTLATAYWGPRAVLRQLLAAPVPTATGVVLVLAGTLGEGVFPVPGVVLGGITLVGALVLAYVGSGQL